MGYWYQRPALHRWTWYNNAGGVAKEIDHILVSTHSSVASLKLHVKSRKPPRCNHTVFYLEKLKDLTCAQEYAVTVSNRFGALDTLEDTEEIWDTFNHETL